MEVRYHILGKSSTAGTSVKVTSGFGTGDLGSGSGSVTRRFLLDTKEDVKMIQNPLSGRLSIPGSWHSLTGSHGHREDMTARLLASVQFLI